jgi:hypothetical protein
MLERVQGQLVGRVDVLAAGGMWCAFNADGTSSGGSCLASSTVQEVGLMENGATTCDLLQDAGVQCFGDNQLGRLGFGDTSARSGGPVGGLGPVRKLAMSHNQVCALQQSGELRCWGTAAVSSQVTAAAPVPGLLPLARDVACGLDHCCALVGDNGVTCWGMNTWNQLGREGDASDAPVSVPMPGRVERLSAGGATTCALLQTGQALCWGDNNSGQLGFAPLLSSDQPVWVTQ